MISRRRFLTLGTATAGAAIFGAADAFAFEPRFGLTIKEWTVAHAHWPKQSKPLRIGVLTDIHAVEPWMPARRVGTIANTLNELKPDVIVLLGDYVNALRRGYYSATVPVSEWGAALGDLHAPLGVYAVLGNHDWWSGEVPSIRRTFETAGICLLENAAIKVAHNGNPVWIAGLCDQLTYNSRGIQDLKATLNQVPEDVPAILLAHEPDIIAHVPHRVTLTLSGHTHGGQVYIPMLGRPAIGAGPYSKYAYGHIVEKGRHLIVSSGLGLSNFPIRFLVPPEIAIVTLRGGAVPAANPMLTAG
jgi:uncharacterized protein